MINTQVFVLDSAAPLGFTMSNGVEPTAHTLPLSDVMTDDVSRPSMPQADVLALAPQTEDGYIRVRAVLE